MNLYDFKYLYAIMLSQNSIAKKYFIADFIFAKNAEISIEKYKRRIDLIFHNQLDLKSEHFIQTKAKYISRELFMKKINNLDKIIEKFHFFSVVLSHPGFNIPIVALQGIKCFCRCISKNVKDKNLLSGSPGKDKYDDMERSFFLIESRNNGVFPINYLENILVEIDINITLVNLIISYLKTKTQKSFIDFKNFKELVSSLSSEGTDKINYFFTILAYPEKLLLKEKLVKVIQNLNKNLKHNDIISLLNVYNINKEFIPLSDFDMFFIENSNLILSLDRIMYIPYLYFNLMPSNKEVEKRCIEIITKGEKDLSLFIKSMLYKESEFYIINSNFWNTWMSYCVWMGTEQECSPNTTSGKEGEKNSNSKNKPKLDLSILLEFPGKLKEGLVYKKDFYIVNKKIWDLISFWYFCNSEEIKRFRIEYSDSQQSESKNSENERIIQTETVLNNEKNKVYEIEVYPIFVNYMSFEDIKNNLNKQDFQELKNYLLQISINRSTRQYKTYSRFTKFGEVKGYLEKMYKLVNNIKSRLWVYHEGHLTRISDLEKNLTDEKVFEYCIVILETMNNNKWPSEMLESDNKNNIINLKPNFRSYVGIMNIGNTCYMNAVCQILLNLEEIKKVFSHPDFHKSINVKNKCGKQGKVMTEFLNICKEKWYEEQTRSLNIRKLKEILGEIKFEYKGNNQQDAHDFLIFLLDILHEEINLKSEKEFLMNPETYNGTDEELANEYWANNLRRNFSFIHSFFVGQLKSNLSCQGCGKTNLQYETFMSLNLPVSQMKNINLNVILHRLPFTTKIYYNEFNKNNIYQELKSSENHYNLREYLGTIRKKSLDIRLTEIHENEEENSTPSNYNAEKIMENNKQLLMNGISNSNSGINYFYTSKLATSIPLKLNIEIDRKLTVDKLIEHIRSFDDLCLEKDEKYTELLIYDLREFVTQNLQIDECFQNNQTIHVYELLNSAGINQLFDYKYEEEKPLIKLNELAFLHFNKGINTTEPYTKQECYEFLIEIRHRYPYQLREYLFREFDYTYLEHFSSFMILQNKKSIKTVHLYEYIFEKYEYVLNNSTKLDKNFDLKKSLKEHVGNCSPFTISIVNRRDLSCPFCVWYKFCTGCILDPKSTNLLCLNPNYIIMINWCNDVVKREINESLFKLTLNHISLKSKEEDKNLKSLEECLNLFIEKEDLGEQNQIMCSNCNKHQNFFKKFDLERLPPVLFLVPKRFKYTRLYRMKIDNYIDFPLYDLDLSAFMTDKSSKFNTKYDLFGVINHSGSLSGGHYTSVIKHQDKWIKYDDSSCYDISENSVKTNQAYILVYRKQIQDEDNNYLKLLNNIYFKKSDEFVIGEPVSSSFGKGYVCDTYFEDTAEFIKIKHKYGHSTINLKNSTIVKELSFSLFEKNFRYKEELLKPINNKDLLENKHQRQEGSCIVY